MTLVWTHDPLVMQRGPKQPLDEPNPYYDPRYNHLVQADSDPTTLRAWAKDILVGIGITRQQLAVFHDLVRASDKRDHYKSPLGKLLSLLYRYRVPGSTDKGNRLFNNCAPGWETFAEVQRSIHADPNANEDAIKNGIPLQSAALTDDMLARFNQGNPVTARLHAVTGVLETDQAKRLITMDRPGATRANYRLVDTLILYGIGFSLGIVGVRINAALKERGNLITALQRAIYDRQLYRMFRITDATIKDRTIDYLSFDDKSHPRMRILKAFRKEIRDSSVTFSDLFNYFEDIGTDTGAWMLHMCRKLSWRAWPNLFYNERTSQMASLRKWLVESVESQYDHSANVAWTPTLDLWLLVCAFELRKAELKDIVQVMLRRGVTLTGGAVLRRLHHLWAQEDTPAVHQLQRSAPRWWESLQLPDDVFDAVDLAYGHREPFMPHQVVEIDPTGYNGINQEIRDWDNSNNQWLPPPNCTDQELVEWLLALEFDKGMLASQAIAAAITVKAIICRLEEGHEKDLGADEGEVV